MQHENVNIYINTIQSPVWVHSMLAKNFLKKFSSIAADFVPISSSISNSISSIQALNKKNSDPLYAQHFEALENRTAKLDACTLAYLK